MSPKEIVLITAAVLGGLATIAGLLVMLWKGLWWALFTILESEEGRPRLARILRAIERDDAEARQARDAEHAPADEGLRTIVNDSVVTRADRNELQNRGDSIIGGTAEFVAGLKRQTRNPPKKRKPK